MLGSYHTSKLLGGTRRDRYCGNLVSTDLHCLDSTSGSHLRQPRRGTSYLIQNISLVDNMLTFGLEGWQRIAAMALLTAVSAIIWVSSEEVVGDYVDKTRLTPATGPVQGYQWTSQFAARTVVFEIYQGRSEIQHLLWTTHTLHPQLAPEIRLRGADRSRRGRGV